MDKSRYIDSFNDLQSHIGSLLSEIDEGDNQRIQTSYLSFLDNFLVLVDQIIKSFHEGKTDNEELAFMMSEKQNLIMSTLNTIISHQKEGDWLSVSSIIKENLEIELQDWKKTVEDFFSE